MKAQKYFLMSETFMFDMLLAAVINCVILRHQIAIP